MPIPSQTDVYGIVLALMQDGEERSRKAINADVASTLCLTEAELGERTESGKRAYESRAEWSVS